MDAKSPSPPSPQEIQRKLASPQEPPENSPSNKHVKPAALTSPPTTDSEDENRGHGQSPTSPPRQLAIISEAKDADDTDGGSEEEDVKAQERYERRQGKRGLKTEADIMSGYLMKKGERRKAWKKRYFVLRPKLLCYYKNDKEYKLLRDIPLSEVQTCAEVQVKRHEHTFGIVTPQRTYYVEARSHQEMQEWVSKIEDRRLKAKRALQEEDSTMTESDIPTPNGGAVASTSSTAPPFASMPIDIIPPSASSTPNQAQFASYLSSSATTDAGTSSYTSGTSDPTEEASAVSPLPTGLQLTGLDSAMPTSPSDGHRSSREFSRRSRDNSASGYTSSGNEGPSYFNSPHHGHHPVMTRHPSEQIISSSDEDDDDFDNESLTPGPGSPLTYPKLTPTIASPPDPKKVIMSGYLTKQGKRKTWRKRYFTLVSSRLMYSRSHMDAKIQRSIPLARILDVMEYEGAPPHGGPLSMRVGRSSSHAGQPVSPGPGGHGLACGMEPGLLHDKRYDNCFKIITAKRTFLLCAPDEETEIKWISAMKVLLQASRSSEVHLPKSSSLPLPNAATADAARSHAPESRQSGLPSIEAKLQEANVPPPPVIGRNRSATDAAREAVQSVSIGPASRGS